MRKFLMLGAALSLSLSMMPAHAFETIKTPNKVGDVISFRRPLIGCTFYGDAREAARLRWVHDSFGYAQLALRLAPPTDAHEALMQTHEGKIRYCEWFVADPWVEYAVADLANDARYPIEQREIAPPNSTRAGTSFQWFCLVRNEHAIQTSIEEAKPYCLWVWLKGGV